MSSPPDRKDSPCISTEIKQYDYFKDTQVKQFVMASNQFVPSRCKKGKVPSLETLVTCRLNRIPNVKSTCKITQYKMEFPKYDQR